MSTRTLALSTAYQRALFVALLAALLGVGCSQKKDAFLNRTFHRLTARDNGWFNANEKLKEVVRGIEDAHVDNYDEVLPIFVYGTEEEARAAVPDLEKCIDKCSLVIERHSMDIEGKERNQWIDDAWFVIAKSHFYKQNYYEAERGFTYISRRFKDGDRKLESLVWQARTAIQLEQFAKAQSSLDQIRDVKKMPKGFDQAEMSAVQAELELKRGKVDDAIMHLELALPITKDRRSRVRWAFILAQLYQVKGLEEKAIAQFAAVGKMSPPYEMAFHAQIFQAMAFNKGDTKVMRQKLNRMLRDDKHLDHFDMIHYALADLDLKDRKKPEAMAHLVTSAKVSTTDTKQKAKTFLKLADINFGDRIYAQAQKYYDSTRTLLSEEHVRFDEVDTRARVLGDLVEQLGIIAREDSLQALAQLDEEELGKKIKGIIRDREREEDEKLRLEEEARAMGDAATGKPTTPAAPTGARGSWYFYDPQQIGRGLAQFRKRWGNRPLEDDWRRKDKSGSALAESLEEEGEESLEESQAEGEKPEAEWKDPSFYLKDLPRDDADIQVSNGRICEALYVSGMIYKEQLKDVDNATESFEVLNNRFDECRYTPESYYQLYRIYLEKEQGGWFSLEGIGSQTYADIIMERWPTSEFARLVRDPNVLQADEQRKREEEEAYRTTYQQYRQYAFIPVVNACNKVIQEEPRNNFRPKYHILKAMAMGGLRDMDGYREALTELKVSYPGTDEAKAADDMLAALDQGPGAPPAPRTEGTSATYTLGSGPHFYVVVVPNRGNDLNQIKTSISNFGIQYVPTETLQITNSFLDAERQVILVDRLGSKESAMNYHRLFTGNSDVLGDLNNKGFTTFAISPENYTLLYKSKDIAGYTEFFLKNYVEAQ
jgi:tetratricopeptide (TPR) repeat protein